MQSRLIQAGGALAVSLPAEIVKEFNLKTGMSVEVSIHPQTRAITVQPGVRMFENGKATKKFTSLADALLKRRAGAYRELAK